MTKAQRSTKMASKLKKAQQQQQRQQNGSHNDAIRECVLLCEMMILGSDIQKKT